MDCHIGNNHWSLILRCHGPVIIMIWVTFKSQGQVQTLCHEEENPSGEPVSSSSQHLETLHLQQRIHGAASKRNGEATNRSTPKPAKIPTTCKHIYMTL